MNFKLKILSIITLFTIVFAPFILSYGGISGDFPAYLKIASEIPSPSNNLFPIGFPLILNVFSLLTKEYFYSSILLKIVCFISIIGFAIWKRFYVTEIIILLTLKSIVWTFIHQGSEYISYPFLFIYIYLIHQLFDHKISTKKFILFSSVIAFILVSLRYANVFIFIATFLFYIICYKRTKKYTLPIILHLGLSAILISVYLLFNYIFFGSFTNENNRINNEYDNFLIDTYYDFIGVINLFNPLFYIKPLPFISTTQIIISILLIAFDLALIYYISKWIIKIYKQHKIPLFECFLIISALIISILTFITAIFQGIEPLAQRLLANSFFLLWFGILILVRKQHIISTQNLVYFAFASLILQTIYIVRIPTNFIHYKNEIETVLKKRQSIPIAYYDDLNETKVSVYQIPIVNKQIEKVHEQFQPKNIHKAILRINYPSIIILDEKPKSFNGVILSSELKITK